MSETKPLFDSDLVAVKEYLVKIKADLYELENCFNLNFLEERTPHKYFIFVIFFKLSAKFHKEIFLINLL